jgi:hypothetical protein
MKVYPSFGRGVLIAAGVTVIGTLATSFGASHLGISLMALAYLCHTLYHSPRSTGRVALFAAWLVGSIALSLLDASMATTLSLNLGSLWLARSWCHLDTVLQALTDLGLWLTSLALASATVVHSASYPLGIWTFFLVQALWPWLAQKTAALTLSTSSAHSDNYSNNQQQSAFNEAKRNAENALHRLQSQS